MTRMSLVTPVTLTLLVATGCEEWDAAMQNAAPQRPQPQLAQQHPPAPPPVEWRTDRDETARHADTAAAEAVREYLADLDATGSRQSTAPRTAEPAPRLANPPPRRAPRQTAQAPMTYRPPNQPARATRDVPTTQPVAHANVSVTLNAAPEPVSAAQANTPRLVSVSVTPRHKGMQRNHAPAANSIAAVTPIADITPHKPLLIDQLIAQTEAELAGNPSDARLQWRLGLLRLAADKPAQAGELSPELTEARRGLLARQVAFESALQAVLDGDAGGVDRAYAALEALRDDLRGDAELALPTLALCNKVTTFGVYDELPDTALAPFQANRAIVYCEIGNLATETDSTGYFRTLLSTRLELFTKDGQSRWVHEEQRIEDVSRQRRDDFFIAQLVTFPANLGPGEYILKATVTDLLASKTNETSRGMTIGGNTALSSAAP